MAYVTSQAHRQQIKDSVFRSIAPGDAPVKSGREMYRICGVLVHARYCAPGSGNYKFNINPNTLRADYELWICGAVDHWYLIPIDLIRKMYDHPTAYPDNHHPDIRVVSVDSAAHWVGYAARSVSLDLASYFCATLDPG